MTDGTHEIEPNHTVANPVDALVMCEKDYKYSIKSSFFPVGSFVFTQNSKTASLEIKDNITANESAHLSVLLAQAAASVMSSTAFAWVDYIYDNQIDRHFNITNT